MRLLLNLAIGIATALFFQSGVCLSAEFSPPNCDFSVMFPSSPVIGYIDSDDGGRIFLAETAHQQLPHLSARCIPSANALGANDEQLRALLLSRSRPLGLKNVRFETRRPATGLEVSMVGQLTVDGYALMIRTTVLAGRRSFLMLGMAEPPSDYPSPTLSAFLAGVRRR